MTPTNSQSIATIISGCGILFVRSQGLWLPRLDSTDTVLVQLISLLHVSELLLIVKEDLLTMQIDVNDVLCMQLAQMS